MADGKVSFAYSRFLGLDKDKETGKIVVNPEQAETVRLIFHLFLEGMTPHSTDRYRKVIYRCNRKYNGEKCQTPHVTEDEIKAAFVSAYNQLVTAISAKEAQSERLADFIKVLKDQDGTISEFDGSLWGSMIEFVTVGRDKEITVTFRDGTEIQA